MSEQLTTRIAALEEDRQQLRAILSGMVEGVVALDADQRILFANDRAVELLEFPTQTPVGRRLWEVVRRRPLLDLVQLALERPEPCREELRSSDGSSPQPHRPRRPPARPAAARRRARAARHHRAAAAGTPPPGVRRQRVARIEDAADRHQALHRDAPGGGRRRPGTTACASSNRSPTRVNACTMLILDLLSLARIESGEEQFEFEAVAVPAVVSRLPGAAPAEGRGAPADAGTGGRWCRLSSSGPTKRRSNRSSTTSSTTP